MARFHFRLQDIRRLCQGERFIDLIEHFSTGNLRLKLLPALKSGGNAIFFRRIRRVVPRDCMRRGSSIIAADKDNVSCNNLAALIPIVNGIRLEHHGVIGELGAVRDAFIQLIRHIGTHVCDGLGPGRGGIILNRRPAVEHRAVRESSGARIVDVLIDLVKLTLGDHHALGLSVSLDEVDLETRIIAGLGHDVNGEMLCREADRFIVGGYGRHKLAAVAALVINLQRLSIAERIIRDGDRDRFLRLPALTVLIENGDIIGSEHRLIGRGGAGGALGGSSTIDALESHLRLGCALLDSGHAAAYRQNAVNTDIASGQSLLFGRDGLLGGGLFSRGCRDLDQTDTGGRIAHRNGREIAFAGDDLQLAALRTAVQRDESKRLALFKRRHRLDADSQLEILAIAADRPAFKTGTSLDGSDGAALQLGCILIGGIAALCHSDGIFALALVAVRYVDGLFALDDGLFGGLGILRELGRLGILRELGRLGILRELGRLGIIRELGRLGRRLSRGLGRRLRKLGHAVLCVSAVVQAGGQGLIAGPQYHQQGKQKREYALRQFVHLMRASYSLRGGGSRRRALFTALWVLLVRCHWVLLCTLRLLCCFQQGWVYALPGVCFALSLIFLSFPPLVLWNRHAAIERAIPLFPVKRSFLLTLPFGEAPLSRTLLRTKLLYVRRGHDLPPRLRRRSGLVNVLFPCARLRRRTQEKIPVRTSPVRKDVSAVFASFPPGISAKDQKDLSAAKGLVRQRVYIILKAQFPL